MSDRPLPYGRVFVGPVDAPVEDMWEVGYFARETPSAAGTLRAMSPYALVGRRVRVPASVAGPAGKVWSVWCVNKRNGMVWVADGRTAHEATVLELDIVVTAPHLCRNDELCCDECMTHLGCRCPEPTT